MSARARFEWVKSISGGPVKIGDVTVTGEPVRVLVNMDLATAYRDRQIILLGRDCPVMSSGKKKDKEASK